MKKVDPWNLKGFSLLEVLASVAIVSVLMALVFPSALKYREQAREAKCVSNLRAISAAVGMYVAENDGRLPNSMSDGVGWKKHLAPFLGLTLPSGGSEPGSPEAPVTVFTCPAVKNDNTPTKRSYGFNSKLHDSSGDTEDSLPALANKSKTVLMADCFATSWLQAQGNLSFRHEKRTNALFCDGHVEALTNDDVTRIGQSKLIEGKY